MLNFGLGVLSPFKVQLSVSYTLINLDDLNHLNLKVGFGVQEFITLEN